MTGKSGYIGVLCGMVLAGPSLATDSGHSPQDLFDLSLEELSQIKVSVASRNAQLLRDAASLVTVFTDNDLQRLGVRTLGELLGYVPGMRSYRNSGTSPWLDSYEVRGVRDDFSSMLLLMVDGRRINSPYNGGTGQMFQHLLGNASRVEIIRGPGSALYGSSALLGVINIITRGATERLRFGVGSDGLAELAASSGFSTGDWYGNAHVALQRSDGQDYRIDNDTTGRTQTTRDPYRSENLSANLGYQALEWYGWAYQQELDDFYQVNFVHPDNRTEQDGYETGVRTQWEDQSAGWQVKAQLSRHVIDQISYANRAAAGSPPFLAADWLGGFSVKSASDALDVDGVWQLTSEDAISAGLRLSEERIHRAKLHSNYRLTDFAYLGELQDINDLVPPVERNVTGAYLQHQRQWSPHWQTTLGLRHDNYEDSGSDSSPRLAVSYYDGDNNTIKLMWGQAYRAPAFNELFTMGNPVSLGNENLNAVRSETLELGWLHEANNWRLDASLFDQTIRDQILSEFIGPGLRQFVNKGELQVRGAELDWLWSWSAQWRSRFYASWVADINEDLGDSTGQDSGENNTPHRWGGAELNYVSERWSWHLAGQYTGQIDSLANQDAYWLWRSRVNWRWQPTLELSLTVNNLFDTSYETLSSLAGFGINDDGDIERRLPGRGREVWLHLDWHW